MLKELKKEERKQVVPNKYQEDKELVGQTMKSAPSLLLTQSVPLKLQNKSLKISELPHHWKAQE